MKIVGIIPARAGSKRVPNKNIRLLGNKPLIQHAIETSVKAKLLNRIVVSSDSPEVLEIAYKFNQIIPIKRPEDLANDLSPAIDYVNHTLSFLKETYEEEFDAVVIIQPSSPLTLPWDIDSTIQKLIDSNSDTAVSVVELSHMVNPLKLKILKEDKLIPYLEDEKGRMASQEIPKVFVRNCAVYATKIQIILEGRIIGDDCRAYIMPQERSVDINDFIDFEFAEFLYNKSYKNA